jgi:hypothetical protein
MTRSQIESFCLVNGWQKVSKRVFKTNTVSLFIAVRGIDPDANGCISVSYYLPSYEKIFLSDPVEIEDLIYLNSL